jgi:hypothetical protein
MLDGEHHGQDNDLEFIRLELEESSSAVFHN